MEWRLKCVALEDASVVLESFVREGFYVHSVSPIVVGVDVRVCIVGLKREKKKAKAKRA